MTRSTKERKEFNAGFHYLLNGSGHSGVLFRNGGQALLDNDEIHALEKKNSALHRENAYLRKACKTEVIEIVDKRGEVDFSQKW